MRIGRDQIIHVQMPSQRKLQPHDKASHAQHLSFVLDEGDLIAVLALLRLDLRDETGCVKRGTQLAQHAADALQILD